MILFDTGVLIHHLRRRENHQPPSPYTVEIRRLATLRAIVGIPGMAFQEVLAGARTDESLLRLERDLRSMAQILPATEEDHALAGQLASFCRRRGVATGAPDVLIAAQALSLGASIFAEDTDYTHIQSVFPLLSLHHVGDPPAEVMDP